jgi:hypothetical protein
MKIADKHYAIEYDATTTTLSCQGAFRLYSGYEYDSITDLLHTVATQKPATLTLDLRNLHFLNSLGINMLYKLVIHVRDYQTSHLVVQGIQQSLWQGKLVLNFQRLMPGIVVEWNNPY